MSARKPTRAECVAQAAPHLAALVLARRADRAQSTDADSDASPPLASGGVPERPTAA